MAGYFTAWCNEISRCCYDFYHTPFTKKNLLIIGGVIIGIILLIIIIVAASGYSNGNSTADFLDVHPLIDGYNNFASTLKCVNNNVITGLNLEDHKSFCKSGCNCQTDFKKLNTGKVSGQVWVANVDCNSQYKDSVSRTLAQIDLIKRMIKLQKNPDGYLVTEPNDIKLGNGKSIGGIMAVGGGHQLDMRTSIVRMYYDLGVRIMAPVANKDCVPPWFYANGSLNNYGKIMISQMNYLGVLLDLTGMNSIQTISVLQETKAPVIFSHTCENKPSDVDELNIDSKAIELIRTAKGPLELSVLMITLNPDQLWHCIENATESTKLEMKNVTDYFEKIKKNYSDLKLGIGSAFDSSNKTITGLEDASKFPNLFKELEKKLSSSFAAGVAGENFLKCYKSVYDISIELQNKYAEDKSYQKDLEGMESYEEISKSNFNNTCYTDPSYFNNSNGTTPLPTATPSSGTTTTTPKQ